MWLFPKRSRKKSKQRQRLLQKPMIRQRWKNWQLHSLMWKHFWNCILTRTVCMSQWRQMWIRMWKIPRLHRAKLPTVKWISVIPWMRMEPLPLLPMRKNRRRKPRPRLFLIRSKPPGMWLLRIWMHWLKRWMKTSALWILLSVRMTVFWMIRWKRLQRPWQTALFMEKW